MGRKKEHFRDYCYAVVQKKDGYEEKRGSILQLSISRRALLAHYNKKYQKVVKVTCIFEL